MADLDEMIQAYVDASDQWADPDEQAAARILAVLTIARHDLAAQYRALAAGCREQAALHAGRATPEGIRLNAMAEAYTTAAEMAEQKLRADEPDDYAWRDGKATPVATAPDVSTWGQP